MKKGLCLGIAILFILSILSGCTQTVSNTAEESPLSDENQEEEEAVEKEPNIAGSENNRGINIENESEGKGNDGDYRNFYGIAWNGNPIENLKYAKQMGYDYVFYQSGMELLRASDGLKFYIETPEYEVYPVDRVLRLDREYTPEQQANYEKLFAWKSLDPFPNNIATGWFSSDNTFSVQPDFQQQAVIDFIVDEILKYVELIENKAMMYGIDFKFGGFAWDVPNVTGDFWDRIQSKGGRQITLAYWTGEDSSLLHDGITHEYATYTDGTIAYYKTLFKRTREKYPDAKFIIEPYNVYSDWFAKIEGRDDLEEFNPDFITSESRNLDFLKDERVLGTGLAVPERLGCTTPDVFDEAGNRKLAGELAAHGAWFSWYGRFGGTGNMPPFQSITEVPDRLKLIRMIPNWDNLAKVPLSDRKWDGEVYSSPNSYASEKVIYSRHPDTKKLFIVFLDKAGVVELQPGEEVLSVSRVDGMFIESEDGRSDLLIENGQIKLANEEMLEKGFIVELKINS